MALGSFCTPVCCMMPYLPELVLEEHYGLGSLIADCRGHGAGWFGTPVWLYDAYLHELDL